MSAQLRPYKAFFPQIGLRVMIDASSVVIGDVRIADDVSVWPLVAIRGDVNYVPRFYVSTSKSIIKALINMHSFEIQLSPIG